MNKVPTPRFLLCALLALAFSLATGCKKQERTQAAPGAPATSAGGPPTAAAPPTPGPTADRDLVVDKVVVERQTIEVAHSKFDGGRSEDLFDTDPNTLARTANANPATVELRYSTAKAVKNVSVTTGSMDLGLTVTVTPERGQAKVFNKEFRQLPNDPTVSLPLEGNLVAKKVRVDIKNLNGGDGHIHIRTLRVSSSLSLRLVPPSVLLRTPRAVSA